MLNLFTPKSRINMQKVAPDKSPLRGIPWVFACSQIPCFPLVAAPFDGSASFHPLRPGSRISCRIFPATHAVRLSGGDANVMARLH
jgi:hypothetical protein